MSMIYDCIIIGAGPAGLSAAIYLARYNRSVLVIDSEHGRWRTHEINENYLGFSDGISSIELRERGKKQAEHFGAKFVHKAVADILLQENIFKTSTDEGVFESKSIILATGVKDIYPEFEHKADYIGRSLFWCITCDGFKIRNRKIVVVGSTDDAVCSCLQFTRFTPHIVFVTNTISGENTISAKWKERLEKFNIPFYEGKIAKIEGKDGYMQSLELDSGVMISTEFLFNQQPALPNSHLAKQLGVLLDEHGYVKTDLEQRTNIPFVYAAGDVTRNFSHQIVTAAYEGATAADVANYDLYPPELRED